MTLSVMFAWLSMKQLSLITQLPARRAAAVVADYSGLRKKQLYDFLLEHKESGEQ